MKKIIYLIKYNCLLMFLLIGITSSFLTLFFYFINEKTEYQKNSVCYKNK